MTRAPGFKPGAFDVVVAPMLSGCGPEPPCA
jgi:hypothetical protein